MMPAYDKLLHFAAGALTTFVWLAAGVLAQRLGMSAPPMWCGLFGCFLAAVLREAWNRRNGGVFSRADIAATLLGSPMVLGAFWLGTAK